MAITIAPISLSISNPALAALANRSYANTFTDVPNRNMPSDMLVGLSVIHLALTGEELDLTGNTLAVSASDGQLQRLYAPKLYAKLDGKSCYIRWGSREIPLEVIDGKLVPTTKVKGYKVTTKFANFNPSGRGEDPAIEIKVTPPKGEDSSQVVHVVSFAVAPADWKSYDAAKFETVLETDDMAFYELLAPEGTKSSGSDVSGEVYDERSFRTALFGQDMPQTYELEFQVTGFKPVKTSYGTTYILQLQPTDSTELISHFPGTAAKFGLWAPRYVKGQMSAVPTPVISVDKPVTFVMPIGKPAYLRFASFEQQEGALDLDFG
jgi:hypothetical protein